MDKAIIIGAGTYGQVYAEYLKDLNKYEIIGFIDDDPEKLNQEVIGIKVLGPVALLENLEHRDQISVFVPIGNNKVRERILEKARAFSFNTPSFIHPKTCIHGTVIIGQSVYVLPSTNIMPLTKIEDNVMISMGVNIAHHTVIEKGCFISQGVNVGASITIERYAFLGIGSTIMTGVKTVGANTVVGAGAVVIKTLPCNCIAAGVPAKIIKQC